MRSIQIAWGALPSLNVQGEFGTGKVTNKFSRIRLRGAFNFCDSFGILIQEEVAKKQQVPKDMQLCCTNFNFPESDCKHPIMRWASMIFDRMYFRSNKPCPLTSNKDLETKINFLMCEQHFANTLAHSSPHTSWAPGEVCTIRGLHETLKSIKAISEKLFRKVCLEMQRSPKVMLHRPKNDHPPTCHKIHLSTARSPATRPNRRVDLRRSEQCPEEGQNYLHRVR